MTTTISTDLRSRLTLDPLGPSFGAEVIGLDIRTATDDQVAAIHRGEQETGRLVHVLVAGGQHLGVACAPAQVA